MDFVKNISLAAFTSFGVGGPAEFFTKTENSKELLNALQTWGQKPLQVIGQGSNTLISDLGLKNLTIVNSGGNIDFVEPTLAIADSGADWDELVQQAIQNGLWGAEFMSKIPGTVGGSTFINITAYGQSLGKLVEWVEVFDRESQVVKKLLKEELFWGYKTSIFQTEIAKNWVILRVAFRFSKQSTGPLLYQRALDAAEEIGANPENLEDRRKIIIHAREAAGSNLNPEGDKTAGSFFRNPIVGRAQVEQIIAHDETGKTAEQIKKMNSEHGGNEQRVSAAHVMLASGFKRGQIFANGRVKLNDQNLLKIEALEGAKAQDIYQTMLIIQSTVLEKLGIDLEPEVRIMGEF